MAIAVVPELNLREPGTAVHPLRVPIGPVIANLENPLAERATWAYLLRPDRNWNVPIIGTKTLTRSNYVPKPSLAGLGLGTSSTSSNGLARDDWEGFLTSDGAGTGDFAVLVVAAPENKATQLSLVGTRDTGNATPYNQLLFRVNAYYDAGDASSTLEAGNIYFGTYTATVLARGVRATNRVNGFPHAWLGVRRNNVYELWEDGIFLGSASGSGTGDISNDVYTAIGGHGYSATLACIDAMHFIAEFDFAPNQGDCISLSRDPFQLLKPA